MERKYVPVWGQTQVPLSLFYYPEKSRTFRLVINPAVSGEKVRITLSNVSGKNDIEIKKITVSECDENGNIKSADDIKICTCNGNKSVIIKKGERVTLDETDCNISANSYLCVSAFAEKGDLTSGNLMNNALLLTADGDNTETLNFSNKQRKRDSVIKIAGVVTKLPLHRPIPIFETVEFVNTENAKAAVVFGDSLSQQGFWTNPFEKRIKSEYGSKYALINRSAMGNRVLRDCSPKFILKGLYGKKATERIKDDILCFDNVSHAILFIGINDIIQYGTMDASKNEKPDINELFNALKGMTEELHEKNIKVMIFTIPAFGAAASGSREKDSLRKELNALIKQNESLFDAVFDCADVIGDKNDDYYVSPEYLGGDKMHINAHGGEIIANAIDINFFE